MKQQPTTIISLAVQQALRSDTTLGSGNFLDRAHALNPNRDIDFLFLEIPMVLPDGSEHCAFSLDTLMDARRRLAQWYSCLGVEPGEVMTICVTDGIAPFLHYLALTSLGAVVSVINPAMSPDMAKAYIRQNGFYRLVVDNGVLARSTLVEHLADADPVNCEVINYSDAMARHLGPLPTGWPFQHQDATLVMLSHTSGTTAVSKAVRFEHRQFFMGKRARIGQFAESSDERFLTALPQSHSSAISHLETAVVQGIPTFVLSHSTGEPVRAALKHFAPTVVAGFPQTYASLVQAGVVANEFASVRRWFSMGDAAHADHIRRILIGSPGARFIDSFGSSELGMALFRKVSTSDSIAPHRCVGRPVEVAVAKVLDFDTGAELEAEKVGLLAVRAPTITPGYWNKPEATAKAWRQGYFLTGDVGFCKDNDFYLIDRAVDMIFSATGTLYTLVLEEAAQQVDGVCDASVVGVAAEPNGKEHVFALILPDQGRNGDAQRLANAVWQVLHNTARENNVRLAEQDVTVAVARDLSSFPLGATGKVLKRRLREAYPSMLSSFQNNGVTPENILYLTNGLEADLRAGGVTAKA